MERVRSCKNDRVDFHYRLRRKDLFKDVSVADVRWMSGWLSQLSDRQLEDAFRAANYKPDEVRMMTQAVRRRISELNATQNTLAVARKR